MCARAHVCVCVCVCVRACACAHIRVAGSGSGAKHMPARTRVGEPLPSVGELTTYFVGDTHTHNTHMHRSCPGVRFGAGAEDTGAPPGAGCRRLTSSVFLSSFLAVSRMSDIRLLPRLFIFPESEADAAFVFCFIELISSAALVFSFIELMSSPLENRPRNELPLVPPAASDGGTFCVPALFSSCQEKASRARQRATITSPGQQKICRVAPRALPAAPARSPRPRRQTAS